MAQWLAPLWVEEQWGKHRDCCFGLDVVLKKQGQTGGPSQLQVMTQGKLQLLEP